MIKQKPCKEIWIDIADYEGTYQVSNFGRVKSNSKILNQYTTKKGYKSVSLCANLINKHMVVHRLVAKAFIINEENKPQVNHIDRIKTNNFINNLEWCTNRENTTHSFFNRKSSSKHVGIHYVKKYNKWCPQIRINNITYSLGFCDDEDVAHEKYKSALNKWLRNNELPKINRRSTIYQKNMDGNIVNTFQELKDVHKKGYCITSVSMSINGNYPHKNNLYRGYEWTR